MNSWKPLLRPIGRGLLAALLFLVAMYFFGQWRDALLQARTTQAPPPFRGMALGTFHQDNNHDYEGDLREIKALGANAILVMVPWYQKDIRSNRMEPRYDGKNGNRTLDDPTLAKIISQAHGLGMKVLLMPYLRFDQRATKEWRGVLKPEDFKLWANHYTEFILHYARLAEKHGVEILSVGSELGSLEDKTDFWREVIARTRSQYPGKLVYSANWDHYEHPTFWGDLDYIGITSYHRLTEVLPPSSKDLRENLTKIKQQTLDFVKKFPGKKLLITEVGYPSLQGASKDPWNYFIDSPVDTAEQALCYSAFIATWNDTPLLEGVFWWVWYGQGGADDKSYTPRGKPAEQELARWYGGNSEKNLKNIAIAPIIGIIRAMVFSRKKQILCAGMLAWTAVFVLGFFTAAEANTRYMRGPKAVHPHSVNRFQYTHPAYRARNPKPVRKCIQLGQARCMNQKPPAQPYLRHPNGVRTTDIHPLIRKVFKPYVKRYH